jgi:Fe-Mn family superoxide dismutase
MEQKKLYELPPLPYGNNALAPSISEEQLRLHHDMHHAAYVKNANDILEKLDASRKDNTEPDYKSLLKALSFNIGGHVLHSKFWKNMAPAGKGGGGNPEGMLEKELIGEFGSVERFKKEFTSTANSVEGSGWAVLTYSMMTGRPLLMQVEKHNVNVIPGHKILMALDVWEHAYYLDYKNQRGKFVDAFWNVVNWTEIGSRLEKAKSCMK